MATALVGLLIFKLVLAAAGSATRPSAIPHWSLQTSATATSAGPVRATLQGRGAR